MTEKIAQMTASVSELEKKRDSKLCEIGNLVYHDVPVSKDENENKIVYI